MDEQKKNERGLSVGAHGDVLTDVLDVGATAIIESLDRGVYAGKEPYLEIEGGKEVFYRGDYVTQIALTKDELLVGRRDVIAGHYPDVDVLEGRQERVEASFALLF